MRLSHRRDVPVESCSCSQLEADLRARYIDHVFLRLLVEADLSCSDTSLRLTHRQGAPVASCSYSWLSCGLGISIMSCCDSEVKTNLQTKVNVSVLPWFVRRQCPEGVDARVAGAIAPSTFHTEQKEAADKTAAKVKHQTEGIYRRLFCGRGE